MIAAIGLLTFLIFGCGVGLYLFVYNKEPWSGSVKEPGHYLLELRHAGLLRSYELHVPASYVAKSTTPVLFDLHPFITNASIMEMMTGFRDHSDSRGFILVQPNGIRGSWNGGPKCCSPANRNGIDDVAFIRAVRNDLVARGLAINLDRIYLDGMSNGGYLANRVACEDTELVAGIAVVVGSIGYESVAECQPTKPVPVLMISGGDDNLVEREATFSRWLELNRCSSRQTERFGAFACDRYTDCAEGVETTHCVGAGVGHCWPGTDFRIYGCNQDLDASEYIWDFFERAGAKQSRPE